MIFINFILPKYCIVVAFYVVPHISVDNIQLAKFKNEAEGKEELARELKEIKENLRNKDFNEFIDKQIETGILPINLFVEKKNQ